MVIQPRHSVVERLNFLDMPGQGFGRNRGRYEEDRRGRYRPASIQRPAIPTTSTYGRRAGTTDRPREKVTEKTTRRRTDVAV